MFGVISLNDEMWLRLFGQRPLNCTEAKVRIETRRWRVNQVPAHSSVSYLTLTAFAVRLEGQHAAAADVRKRSGAVQGSPRPARHATPH